MSKDYLYDIAIIGGGISSCVFTSTHIKNGFKGRIAVIENGRNLGGRSSTRKSFTNPGWHFNHGAPNFNICNRSNNQLLKKYIQELLETEIIKSDNSDFIELNGSPSNCKIKSSDFYSGKNYIPRSSMSELSMEIISMYDFNNQIDYYFKTLIVKLCYENNKWVLISKNGIRFKARFLVCSSNLILHKRSLEILKIKQIPLRNAIPIYKNKKIDKIIKLLNNQDYIQRLTFLIYTKPYYCYKDNYKNKYRYFLLNKILEDKFKFERIIFQKQLNNKLGLVIHTRNSEFINEYFQSKNKDKFNKNIINNFNLIFDENPFINKIIDYKDISTMIWRASQPSGLAIPENLQVCMEYNIAFCGDWFDNIGFGRIEGAILSALKLSYKINSRY